MKHLALLVIPFSLCMAQEPAPEESAAETPPSAEQPIAQTDDSANLEKEAKPYLDAARRQIELLGNLRDILKGVRNTESANAAAEKVDALAQQVKLAMEQEQALPEPSQEIQYIVSAETANYDLEELTNESIGRAIAMQETDSLCWGSGALDQALSALLSLYLQDEDEE